MRDILEVWDLLATKGPLLGSEIAGVLGKDGVRPNTIRQQIHRAFKNGFVQRTTVSFGKGQYLYFVPHENKGKIHRRILEVIKQRRRLNRLFEALKARRILPEWYAAKISGVCEEVPRDRKADSLSELFHDLGALGLGKVIEFKHGGENCRFLTLPSERRDDSRFERFCRRLSEEEKMIEGFFSLLESSGLGTNFEAKPDSVSAPADAIGDCKPYLRAGKQVHSKVLVEINTLWELNTWDLEGLLDRVHCIRKELDVYSVIVWIVAVLQKPALEIANKIGWKAIRPSRIERIMRIENVRRQGVLLLREAPSRKFRNIVREIRSLDDLANLGNYKSVFFESMVRGLFDSLGYVTRQRKLYYLDGENNLTEYYTKRVAFEVDILCERSNGSKEISVCECKNWLDAIGTLEIKRFARKLEKLNDYYKKKEKEAQVDVRGYFVASEVPQDLEFKTKVDLTIMTIEEFQTYAKKELKKAATVT